VILGQKGLVFFKKATTKNFFLKTVQTSGMARVRKRKRHEVFFWSEIETKNLTTDYGL